MAMDKKSVKASEKTNKKSAKAEEKSDKKSGATSIKIKIKAKAGTPEAAKNMLKKAIK